MKRSILITAIALCSLLIVSILDISAWAKSTANLNKAGVILEGYDPVSYFNSKEPQRGVPKYQVKQNNVIYWFANEENQKSFLKEPKKFEPQYEGWCAYAVANSKSKFEVDPKSFLIQDGRLLLFYNGFWGNTREKWLQTKDKDSKTFLKEADMNWPEVKPKEP